MARNVYSFVKVEDKRTYKGIYLSAIGIGAIACIVIMLIASFFVGGKLPVASGAIGYISFFVSVAALTASMNLGNDNEAYGPMIHSSLYVNITAVVVHIIVFFIGVMSIID